MIINNYIDNSNADYGIQVYSDDNNNIVFIQRFGNSSEQKIEMSNVEFAQIVDQYLNIEGIPKLVQKNTNRILTKFEFNSRFTVEELVNITVAALSNPLVAVLMNKFNIAEEIELEDPNVILGLQTLNSLGLLEESRMVEILS